MICSLAENMGLPQEILEILRYAIKEGAEVDDLIQQKLWIFD